jgi:methyl-accepting chemotaxis protein PixJ
MVAVEFSGRSIDRSTNPIATIPSNPVLAEVPSNCSNLLNDPLWLGLVALALLSFSGVAGFVLVRSSRRLSQSLEDLNKAFNELSFGNLDAQVSTEVAPELQGLAHSFNELAGSLKRVTQAQSETLRETQFYADLAYAASEEKNQEVFDMVVQYAKEKLSVDRVVVYSFASNWGGEIIAEAVDPPYPRALNDKIVDACIPRNTLEEYRQGRCVPTNDIAAAGFSPEHMQLLTRLQVKANLVVPVVVRDRLLGLLVAHQCSGTRLWQNKEIQFLQDLARQTGLALSGMVLVAQKEAELGRAKVLKDVTLRIRQSLELEQILSLSVEEVRSAMRCDRVLIYRFNADLKSGVIIAESTAPGWIEAAGETIEDPLSPNAISRYSTGQVTTMDDIDTAKLSACHCAILEKLQVRANIVAPLFRGGKLFGLLCGHECAGPRFWTEEEMDLFSQISAQIGFALDQADLLKQREDAARRAQQLNEITSRMRETLEAERIYGITVQETRAALACDRVVVYMFDQNWQGKITAESVIHPWKPALGANIADPCFAQSYVEKYRKGRVQALNNIYEAQLDPCYMGQLEPFQVKANIVAPILVGNKLLGLLAAHQCAAPRDWLSGEVSFFQQIALQLGFALDQANLLQEQQDSAQRAQQLKDLTSRMRASLNRQQIFSVTVNGLRENLKSDRALIYLFNENWQGTIVAESVKREFPAALGANIADPCFAQNYVDKYKQGRVQALSDIAKADLDPCYMGQLEPFKVKANVVAPILLDGNLLGLLVAHQCSGPRKWLEEEISFVRQVAIQLGFALEQATLLEQREKARLHAEVLSQEQQKKAEAIQQQLIDLLEDVEGAAMGNLTVRADVTTGEIGTVADFFNSIVENLRQVVTQVKQSTLEVNVSLGENEGAMRQLAEQAQKQAEGTTLTLRSVEEMTHSLQLAAENAQQAAKIARDASTTALSGSTAMDLTVRNILGLRETIGETAKKVKRLGESSQQISRVVSLINQIALQTNLLAINAGIEAARAGEDGQGFAVVAEEVSGLAARCAAATQEIERIVEAIQRETGEVVRAMEQGTTQVVEGTQLVENAKHSLEQIQGVSSEIDNLVKIVSDATSAQVQTSNTITHLMEQIAEVASRTSDSSHNASASLRKTVAIARELQKSVETFVVE